MRRMPPLFCARAGDSDSSARAAPASAGAKVRRGIGRARLGENRAGDLFPLALERGGRRRLAGPLVPAAGVHLVAFDPVQIGMRPGALLVGLRLCAAMAAVPVALGLPP